MRTVAEHDIPADMPSIDQAVHNYLIYEDLLPAINVYENNDGPVLTLGLEDKVFYANGVIKNSRGQLHHINTSIRQALERGEALLQRAPHHPLLP